MRYSFSFVDQFRRCPFRWYLKYGLGLKEEEDDSPNHPFKVGHLLHTALEHDLETAAEEYYMKFPIINNNHIDEVIKVQHYLPQVRALFSPEGKHEVSLKTSSFMGYIDYVEYNKDGTVNLYDFKYSNNKTDYLESMQLHIYKYYYEQIYKHKVKHLYYIFVPKIKLDYIDTIKARREALAIELNKYHPEKLEVIYSDDKVDEFFRWIYQIENTTTLTKSVGYQCNWCTFEHMCIKGGM